MGTRPFRVESCVRDSGAIQCDFLNNSFYFDKIQRFELSSWQLRVRRATLLLFEHSLRWKCPAARAMTLFSDILLAFSSDIPT